MYKLLYSEFDPLDIVPDININAWTLDGVNAEVFSRVAKDNYSKYYWEIEGTEEKMYNKNIGNPEDQKGYDMYFTMIIIPFNSESNFRIQMI